LCPREKAVPLWRQPVPLSRVPDAVAEGTLARWRQASAGSAERVHADCGPGVAAATAFDAIRYRGSTQSQDAADHGAVTTQVKRMPILLALLNSEWVIGHEG
jgi:hypothetical protein